MARMVTALQDTTVMATRATLPLLDSLRLAQSVLGRTRSRPQTSTSVSLAHQATFATQQAQLHPIASARLACSVSMRLMQLRRLIAVILALDATAQLDLTSSFTVLLVSIRLQEEEATVSSAQLALTARMVRPRTAQSASTVLEEQDKHEEKSHCRPDIPFHHGTYGADHDV